MTPEVRDLVRRETEHPPPKARDRVWERLVPRLPSPPTVGAVRWAWAGAAFALLLGLVVGTAWLRPRGETRSWRTAGGVVSVTRAQLEYQPGANQVTLRRGRLVASVWGGPPLRVSVREHLVEVEAAVLVVDTAGDSVTIAPVRGWIRVDGERVDATEATRAAAGPTGLEALEPGDAPVLRATRLAELALEAHRWEDAAEALGAVSQSGTLDAEAALVRKGAVELRQLGDPRRALATFEEAARRFPQGSLDQERELSSLEAELVLARYAEVVARARRFLERYPGSERALEVRRLLMGAAWKLGERSEACEAAQASPGASPALDAACARKREGR